MCFGSSFRPFRFIPCFNVLSFPTGLFPFFTSSQLNQQNYWTVFIIFPIKYTSLGRVFKYFNGSKLASSLRSEHGFWSLPFCLFNPESYASTSLINFKFDFSPSQFGSWIISLRETVFFLSFQFARSWFALTVAEMDQDWRFDRLRDRFRVLVLFVACFWFQNLGFCWSLNYEGMLRLEQWKIYLLLFR